LFNNNNNNNKLTATDISSVSRDVSSRQTQQPQ